MDLRVANSCKRSVGTPVSRSETFAADKGTAYYRVELLLPVPSK